MNKMLSEAKSRNAGNFNQYLKKLQQTQKSIASCERAANRFLDWLKKQSIQPEQVSYADVLAYMKHCQKNGAAQRTVQHYLNMVKHFFDYLIKEGKVKTNPVAGIKVQGVKRKTLYHIFQPKELHAIYNSIEIKTLADKRDKVMLGLLVYQGLKTEELSKLEVTDVKLKEGKIEIPGGRKSNARTLQLEPHQVLEIYDYVLQTRKEMVERSATKTEKLFIGLDGGHDVSNFTHYMLVKLGKKYPGIQNAKQIRASVIVKWLKQYNLRQVQYLAGHRYISSTEAYQQSEMEGLTEEVNKFHPLG
jgi:integrase/recombinase XerD